MQPAMASGAHDRGVDPFERLSTEARSALARAQDEAARRRVGYLGTEHLLLGLLGVDGCLAARALADLGVDLPGIRAGMDAAPARRQVVAPVGGRIPTTRLRRVFQLAFGEALRTGIDVVTTGTLLVGLVLEEDGLASHLLRERGAGAGPVRDALERLSTGGAFETAVRPPA